MKDDAFLLITGIIAAAVAWGFWHFLGEQAFVALLAIVLVGLLVDNRRLRRELSRVKQDAKN